MTTRQVKPTLLELARVDNTFELTTIEGRPSLVGKCIHCNAKLAIGVDGHAISSATIEHIVPRGHGGADELENCAIACARCNHTKGKRLDVKPRRDARAQEVFEALLAKRRARAREPLPLLPAPKAPRPT